MPVASGPLEPKDLDAVVARFHECHDSAYGYARRNEPVELVNLRVLAIGKLPELHLIDQAVSTHQAPEPVHRRDVFFDGTLLSTGIYLREELFPGARIDGPAVIEQGDATTVILPGYIADADTYRNLIITQRGDDR